MKRTKLVFAAGAVLALAWLLTRNSPQQPVPAASPAPPEAATTAPSDSKSEASAPSSLSGSVAAAASSYDTFVVEFKKCFPEARSAQTSSAEWLARSERNGDIESRQVFLENLHRRDTNGTEHRLQIASLGSKVEVREFDVDAENLPIPVGQPRRFGREQASQIRDDFLRQGELKFEQHQETLNFKNGLHGEVEWENDQPRDLKMYSENAALYCRVNDCTCRLEP